MNARELAIWAARQPPDLEVYFHADGQGYAIGHCMAVPEWQVAYLGVDKDELAESLSDEMEAEAEDGTAGDKADALADRDVFMQALENSENRDAVDSTRNVELEGDPCCSVERTVELAPEADAATGVM